MIRKRHISGDNLIKLEQELEALSMQYPLVYQSTTQAIGGKWFIHFLIQGVNDVKVPKEKKQNLNKIIKDLKEN